MRRGAGHLLRRRQGAAGHPEQGLPGPGRGPGGGHRALARSARAARGWPARAARDAGRSRKPGRRAPAAAGRSRSGPATGRSGRRALSARGEWSRAGSRPARGPGDNRSIPRVPGLERVSLRWRVDDPATRLGQGTLANLAAGALFTLSGVVASVIVGRVLGPASFATYGVVTTLVGVGYTYIWTGVKETVAQRVAAAPESAPTVMASAMRVQLWAAGATVLAFVVLARPAARLFHDP